MKKLNEGNQVVLANRKIWEELMIFNFKSNEKEVTSRIGNEYDLSGYFEYIQNNLIILYKKESNIFIQINEKEICLNDDKCKMIFTRENRNNSFSIEESNETIFSIMYLSWKFDPLNLVDPSFNDDLEESQDIFLLIYNLKCDKARQTRFYL